MIRIPSSVMGTSKVCRYQMVLQVAKRARQLVFGSEPLVVTDSKEPVSIAVEEFAQGRIHAEAIPENAPQQDR